MLEGKYCPVRIDPKQLEVNSQNILRLLGYENDSTDQMVEELIDQKIDQAINLMSPKAGFQIERVDNLQVKEGLLNIGNTEFQIHKIIASQLKAAEFLSFFAGTIGHEVGNLSKELLNGGEPLEGYILDLIGSEAAEEIASIVHREIEIAVGMEGLSITNRFSPGYCNWDVKEQFKLFEFLQKEKVGISLNDSALMSPVKSVSGIVGIGKEVRNKAYICSKCTESNCIYRSRDNY